MVDPATTRRLSYQAMFFGLAVLFLFIRLLPLSTTPLYWPGSDAESMGQLMQALWHLPTAWPSPDLMLALTFVWVIRRPDYVPVLLIAAIFLLEDMLLMRPPGLWTLIVLIATEILRDRAAQTREMPFMAEWAMVAIVLIGMMLVNRLMLAIVMVPRPGLWLTLMQVAATTLAYPLVVLVSHSGLKLRRAAAGEAGRIGGRA